MDSICSNCGSALNFHAAVFANPFKLPDVNGKNANDHAGRSRGRSKLPGRVVLVAAAGAGGASLDPLAKLDEVLENYRLYINGRLAARDPDVLKAFETFDVDETELGCWCIPGQPAHWEIVAGIWRWLQNPEADPGGKVYLIRKAVSPWQSQGLISADR